MKRGTKSETEGPKVMDPTAKETAVAAPQENAGRACWAIETLREEIEALFPETAHDYSAYNGRNTALGVTFDLSMLDDEDFDIALDVLNLAVSDLRVADVQHDVKEQTVYVEMHSNARTQDSRTPFGLADAYALLIETEGGESA